MATSLDQSNYVKTALRLPPELHADLSASAKGEGRSLNAEIIVRLRAKYEVQELKRYFEDSVRFRDERMHRLENDAAMLLNALRAALTTAHKAVELAKSGGVADDALASLVRSIEKQEVRMEAIHSMLVRS